MKIIEKLRYIVLFAVIASLMMLTFRLTIAHLTTVDNLRKIRPATCRILDKEFDSTGKAVYTVDLYGEEKQLHDLRIVHKAHDIGSEITGAFVNRDGSIYLYDNVSALFIALSYFMFFYVCLVCLLRIVRERLRLLTLILTCCVMVYTLPGCGKKVDEVALSGETYTIQFPIENCEILNLQIPVEFAIDHSVGITDYTFTNGVSIFRSGKIEHIGKTDKETGITESKVGKGMTLFKDFGECTFTISILDNKNTDLWKDILLSGNVTEVSATLDESLRLDDVKYDTKADVMSLSDNGLYMPDDLNKNVDEIGFLGNTCDSISYDDKFIMCYIQDGLWEDIRNDLLTDCICNSGYNGIQEWYDDEDTFYAKSGHNITGVKKLTANSYCVYLATDNFYDYVCTALDRVRFGG